MIKHIKQDMFYEDTLKEHELAHSPHVLCRIWQLDKLKFMVLEARTKGYTIQQNMMYNMHDTYEDIVFILQATKKDNI